MSCKATDYGLLDPPATRFTVTSEGVARFERIEGFTGWRFARRLASGKVWIMDSALITGMAAVLGSTAGAAASIATTWMTQHNQSRRERVHEELHRRETLYGDFITETARLTTDAFGHSLERPEVLATVYAMLARIRLVSSDKVIKAGEECCRYVTEMYARPNMTPKEISDYFRAVKHPLTDFAMACREELDQYVG